MASKHCSTSSAETTTQQTKEKTLVLRTKLTELGESTSADMLWQLGKLQAKLSQAKPNQREKIIEQIIGLFKTNMNEKLDGISKEVKSHAPKAPVRQKGKSEADFKKLEEEYHIALHNYTAYEAEAMKLIQQVMEILLEALKDVEEFCDPLWEMVKSGDEELVDVQVKSFIYKITNDIKTGLLRIVEGMHA